MRLTTPDAHSDRTVSDQRDGHRITRRVLGGLTLGVSAGLLVGCSAGDPSDADLIEWLSGLSGVSGAEFVANDSDTTGHSARITTAPGLSDDGVRSLVDQIGRDYDDHAPPGRPSLQLQVDRFLFDCPSGGGGEPNLSVERALWLRSDGRAISADGRSGRFSIITAPGTVADVVLGFDAVPGNKGRATHEARSEDRWTAISWSESTGLGWALDRALLQRIADLQRRYPGLVWWLSANPSEAKAGLYFATADLSLAALIADADELVRPEVFQELELGWGPARAPYALFASAFRNAKIRAVLDTVRPVPGVAELRVRAAGSGKQAELDELVVRTAAGYRAGLEALRATWDDFVSVSLVREPARYVGQRPPEVFRGSIFDSARRVRTQAALAELDQVLEFGVGGTFTNLIVALDIAEGQLTTALTSLTGLLDGGPNREEGLDEPYEIRVYYRADDRLHAVGTATAGTFARPRQTTTSEGIALADRARAIWERLT